MYNVEQITKRHIMHYMGSKQIADNAVYIIAIINANVTIASRKEH